MNTTNQSDFVTIHDMSTWIALEWQERQSAQRLRISVVVSTLALILFGCGDRPRVAVSRDGAAKDERNKKITTTADLPRAKTAAVVTDKNTLHVRDYLAQIIPR